MVQQMKRRDLVVRIGRLVAELTSNSILGLALFIDKFHDYVRCATPVLYPLSSTLI